MWIIQESFTYILLVVFGLGILAVFVRFFSSLFKK